MNISLLIRRLRLPVLLVCTLVVTGWAPGASGAADKTAKLSGCLIRGEGDGAGYLLANSPTEPWLNSPGRQITPSALGTSGDYATIFYWLDGNGDLKQHIGHRVEVEGDPPAREYRKEANPSIVMPIITARPLSRYRVTAVRIGTPSTPAAAADGASAMHSAALARAHLPPGPIAVCKKGKLACCWHAACSPPGQAAGAQEGEG